MKRVLFFALSIATVHSMDLQKKEPVMEFIEGTKKIVSPIQFIPLNSLPHNVIIEIDEHHVDCHEDHGSAYCTKSKVVVWSAIIGCGSVIVGALIGGVVTIIVAIIAKS